MAALHWKCLDNFCIVNALGMFRKRRTKMIVSLWQNYLLASPAATPAAITMSYSIDFCQAF